MPKDKAIIGVIRRARKPRCFVFLPSRAVAAHVMLQLLNAGHSVAVTDLKSIVYVDVAKVFMSTCETDVILDECGDQQPQCLLVSTMNDGIVPIAIQGLQGVTVA